MANNIISDVDFGELRHQASNLWVSTIKIQHRGRVCTVPIYISMSGTGIEDNQRTAIRLLRESQDKCISIAEDQIRNYARQHNVSEDCIDKSVQLTAIDFPYAQYKPTFGFLYDVSWDESHGAAAKFIDGKFAEVGSQDIIL